MNKKITEKDAILQINQQLQRYYNISFDDATDTQLFKAMANIAMDEMFKKRQKFSSNCKKMTERALTIFVWNSLLEKL